MTVLLIVVYVLVCIFLILVVLLQQGKGADLAGAFGGGGSQTSFGPRARTNPMHVATTVAFVLFVVLSLSLAVISGKRHGASVMEEVETSPPATEETVPVAPGMAGEGTEEPAAAGEAGPVETEEAVPAGELPPADEDTSQ